MQAFVSRALEKLELLSVAPQSTPTLPSCSQSLACFHNLTYCQHRPILKHKRASILPILLQFLGRKAYRDACSQLGIIPVSFVIEHITREEINIKHHGLGPSGAQAIAFALMRNTTTTTLNLRDCAIGKNRNGLYMCYDDITALENVEPTSTFTPWSVQNKEVSSLT